MQMEEESEESWLLHYCFAEDLLLQLPVFTFFSSISFARTLLFISNYLILCSHFYTIFISLLIILSLNRFENHSSSLEMRWKWLLGFVLRITLKLTGFGGMMLLWRPLFLVLISIFSIFSKDFVKFMIFFV